MFPAIHNGVHSLSRQVSISWACIIYWQCTTILLLVQAFCHWNVWFLNCCFFGITSNENQIIFFIIILWGLPSEAGLWIEEKELGKLRRTVGLQALVSWITSKRNSTNSDCGASKWNCTQQQGIYLLVLGLVLVRD